MPIRQVLRAARVCAGGLLIERWTSSGCSPASASRPRSRLACLRRFGSRSASRGRRTRCALTRRGAAVGAGARTGSARRVRPRGGSPQLAAGADHTCGAQARRGRWSAGAPAGSGQTRAAGRALRRDRRRRRALVRARERRGAALLGRAARRDRPACAAARYLQVAVGRDHACALSRGAPLVCWGAGGAGGPAAGGPVHAGRGGRGSHVRAHGGAARCAAGAPARRATARARQGATRSIAVGRGARVRALAGGPGSVLGRRRRRAAARARRGARAGRGRRARTAAPSRAPGIVTCWGANGSAQTVAPGRPLRAGRRGRLPRLRAALDRRRGLLGRERRAARRPPPGGPLHAGQRGRGAHLRADRRRGRSSAGARTARDRRARRPARSRRSAPGATTRARCEPGGPADCWGAERAGQTTLPDENYVQVSAGAQHTCGLTPDGRALCSGYDDYFQLRPAARGLHRRSRPAACTPARSRRPVPRSAGATTRLRPGGGAGGHVHPDRRGEDPQLRPDPGGRRALLGLRRVRPGPRARRDVHADQPRRVRVVRAERPAATCAAGATARCSCPPRIDAPPRDPSEWEVERPTSCLEPRLEPRRPRRHHLRHLRRDRQPRAVPGDPVHAGGVRRRGAPDRRRGRGDDPHPRAPPGRHARRSRSRTSARSPRRSAPQAGDVIINYSTGAIGVPVEKRVAYLRELRPDVAALNMGSMNYAKYSRSRRTFVFDTVFANPFSEIIELLDGDERARHQARARVLRPRPHRQPRAARAHGRAAPAAARGLRHGRRRRRAADRAQPRRDGRQHPRGLALGASSASRASSGR